MIRVRDDDVLLNGKVWYGQKAVDLFMRRHDELLNVGAKHVVALLCGELPLFRDLEEYLVGQFELGLLEPQIHGWCHVDYGKMPLEVTRSHLWACKDSIGRIFDAEPSIWYTPWGAHSQGLRDLAWDLGLELRSDFLQARKLVPALAGKNREEYYVKYRRAEIGLHWWHEQWVWERDIAVIKTLATGDFKYVQDITRGLAGIAEYGDPKERALAKSSGESESEPVGC